MSAKLQTLFVISEQRTGSNLLCDLLSQSEHLPGMSELLNTETHPDLAALNDADQQLRWLAERVAKSRRPDAHFAGGKLMFEQMGALNLDLSQILDEFEAPLVILLFRRDLIDQFISLKRAEQSGEWVAPDNDTTDNDTADAGIGQTVALSRSEVLDFCLQSQGRYQSALSLLRKRDIPHIVMSYEEVAMDRDQVMQMVVSEFAGIPLEKSEPSLRRQRTTSRVEMVDHPELLSQLEATSWVRHSMVTSLEERLDDAQIVDPVRLSDRHDALLAELGWLPGHFYSPYPDLAELAPRYAELANPSRDIQGVDLRTDHQRRCLERFSAAPDPGPLHRLKPYYPDNPAYRAADALVLLHMIDDRPPSRIVEVGCGYSTALLAAVRSSAAEGGDTPFDFTVIDPYPDRAHQLLNSEQLATMTFQVRPVQEEPDETFLALEAGDVLFIDSSHVSKSGSDVNHLIFHVLPLLAPGVRVHLHDIQFPFEYRWDWISEGRAWSESYLIRAFLQYNKDFIVSFFTDFMAHRYPEEMSGLGADYERSGSSLWLERV